MESEVTFLLYYRIITKDYPVVQLVTHESENCFDAWKKAKEEETKEQTVTNVFVEVWKDEKYLSRIVWTDESEYQILNHLSLY